MTEDIVDRLKAEGQLTRNTGTNSIRAVKIQLEKFEDVFSAISDNIARQTEMMAKSLDVQLDNFRISQETKEREQTKEQIDELEADQENTPTKKAEKEKESKDGPGLFSMLGGLSLSKLLLGGALIVGGLFTAYNLAKGFVDELTDGGWTRFEQGLVDFVASIDFESLKTAFDDILTGIIGVVGAITALRLAILGLKASIAAIQLARLLGIGGAAAGAAGAAAGAASGAGRGGFLRGALGAVGRVLTRTPIGAAVAALGGLGMIYLDRQNMTPEEIEENRRRLVEEGAMENPVSEFAPFEDGTYDAPAAPVISPVEEATQNLNMLTEARERMIADARENASTSSIPFNESDEAAITERIDEDIARAREELTRRLTERHSELDQRLTRMEESGEAGTLAYQNLVEEFSRIGGQLIDLGAPPGGSIEVRPAGDQSSLGIITPTPSRIDTASLLSSMIGLSPILTAAGSQVAERVAAATSGAAAMIVVNNSPVISPVTNNVQGAPSVSTSNFFGSGGGSNVNPYGMPSAIS